MRNRNFIKGLYVVLFLLTSVSLKAQKTTVEFDTLIYSRIDTMIFGEDTITYFVIKDDFDYMFAAANGEYEEAIQLTLQEKYHDYEDELSLWFHRAKYYSYLNKPDNAIDILKDNLKRLEYDNREDFIFHWPELIALHKKKEFLNLLDTFLLKNQIDSLSGYEHIADLWIARMKDQAYNYPPFHLKDENEYIREKKLRFQEENEKLLKNIIKESGWPTRAKVGDVASSTAFLIVQHSGDLKFQTAILDTLEKYAITREIDPRSFAYLKDRVLLRTDKKQIFGTQLLKFENDSIAIQEHISEDSVIMFRRVFGLSSWEQYLNAYGLQLPSKTIEYNKNIVINGSFENLIHGRYLSEFKNFYSTGSRSLVLHNDHFKSVDDFYPESAADGEFAIHLYLCKDSRNNDKNWTSRSIPHGKLSTTTLPGVKYEISFHYYNDGDNPHLESLQVALLKDTLEYKKQVLSKGLKIDFPIEYSTGWKEYNDTIVLYDFYRYYAIGSLRDKCKTIKDPQQPWHFGSSFIDNISIKAIREEIED